jgi:rhodanese-related sulfurtransferase
MGPKGSRSPEIFLKKEGSRPMKEIFQEAWNLFVFSSMFALLFNLFYPYGIELKLKPAKKSGVQEAAPADLPSSNSSYIGWNQTHPQSKNIRPTPTATEEDHLQRVSLMGVKDRFDKKSCLFLDARPPDEYKEGHIPGALNFYPDDFDKFAPQVMPNLTDKQQEIICYCHGTACELSIELAKRLTNLGFTNIKVFFGGWPQWKKAGYPVNQGETP